MDGMKLRWHKFRVRLWVAVEKRVRIAYDDLVEAEAKVRDR